jgi:hypothetical protein
MSKSDPPSCWPRVPRPGVSRPGSARKGSAQAQTPSNGEQLAWSEECKRRVQVESGELRRPSLDQSGPALHQRTGSPAPRAKPAGRAGELVQAWGSCRFVALAAGVWRVRGESAGVRRRTRSFPAVAAQGAGQEGLRRVILRGPGMVN